MSTELQQLEHAKRNAVAKDDYLLAHKIQLRIKEQQEKEFKNLKVQEKPLLRVTEIICENNDYQR